VFLGGTDPEPRLFEALAARAPERFTVVTPAPLATPFSPGFSLENAAHEVLLRVLELGFVRAHWVGVEQGGVLALLVHRLAPERVASLVLASTFAHFGAAAGHRALARETRPERAALLRALHAVDAREDLDDVTVPVLVLGGEDDDVTPVEPYLRGLVAGLHAPHVRLFEGVGHLGRARHAETLAEATWAFLATLPRDPGRGFDEPRETTETPCFTAPRGLGAAAPGAVARAATLLAEAARPIAVVAGIGHHAGGSAALGRLARRAALPVFEAAPGRSVELPSEHPSHHGALDERTLAEAELVLRVGADAGSLDASIRLESPRDPRLVVTLPGDPVATLRALGDAFDARFDALLATRIAARREALAIDRTNARRRLEAELAADAECDQVTERLVAHTLGALAPHDGWICSELPWGGAWLARSEPGTLFGVDEGALALARAKKRAWPGRVVLAVARTPGAAGPEVVLEVVVAPDVTEAPAHALVVAHPSELVRCVEHGLDLAALGRPVLLAVRVAS